MHEIRDVNTSQSAREEFNRLGAQGVPAFVIGEQVIVGFDRQRIMELVDYSVESCPACKARMRVPKHKGKIRVTCHQCGHKYLLNT